MVDKRFVSSVVTPFLSLTAVGIAMLVSPAQAQNEGGRLPATIATCLYSTADSGMQTHIVLRLSAFDSDGTAYYRTLSAPLFEITVKPDGSVESNANPCKDELKFKQ